MFLRGRWLVGHVLVVATSAAFVMLGLWQYGRHIDERDARREAERAYAAPAPGLGTGGRAPGERVSVVGTYDPDAEVLLRNRVRDGEAGYDVVTPLLRSDGPAVLVDRGWVSRAGVERGLDDLATPTGTVEVRGTVHESRPLEPDDTVDERAGRVTLPRVDVTRIAEGLGYAVHGMWITAQWQDPAPPSTGPKLPEPPDTDDVDHFSYAMQWFAFAAIPLVGWPLVLARRARRRPGRESAILAAEPTAEPARSPGG